MKAQKIDNTKEKITVDDKEYCGYEKDGCGMIGDCTYYIKDLDGNRQIVIRYLKYSDSAKIEAANPTGHVNYCEFTFLKAKKKAEIDFPGGKIKHIAKILVTALFFKDGKLDDNSVDEFILINGTKHSDKMKRK
jgi:hypothetical protein